MTGMDVLARSAQILIVDDEKTLRLMLSRAMQKEGYQIVEMGSGEQCLTFCQQQLPDIILLDAILPGIDGFTCCTKLQKAFGDWCPPILMVTSLNDQNSVDLAFEVGAIDYVTKPIHWAVLRQRVRRILQANWTLAALHQKMEHERLLMEQLETANRELSRLASVDSLTQLANRRCFDQFCCKNGNGCSENRLPCPSSCLILIVSNPITIPTGTNPEIPVLDRSPA